eukprot:1718016-Alexandrium_andersonii.AAC.1
MEFKACASACPRLSRPAGLLRTDASSSKLCSRARVSHVQSLSAAATQPASSSARARRRRPDPPVHVSKSSLPACPVCPATPPR